MSARKVVIATTSFNSDDVAAFIGRNPAVVSPGTIQQGTRLYADDPIVLAHPTLFVDASIVPPPYDSAVQEAAPQPSAAQEHGGPEWRATVVAYRAWQVDHPGGLPSQEAIAERRKISEDTLARRLRKVGIASWHDVHALVESEP